MLVKVRSLNMNIVYSLLYRCLHWGPRHSTPRLASAALWTYLHECWARLVAGQCTVGKHQVQATFIFGHWKQLGCEYCENFQQVVSVCVGVGARWPGSSPAPGALLGPTSSGHHWLGWAGLGWAGLGWLRATPQLSPAPGRHVTIPSTQPPSPPGAASDNCDLPGYCASVTKNAVLICSEIVSWGPLLWIEDTIVSCASKL